MCLLRVSPAGHEKLARYHGFFQDLNAQAPDITLFELRDALADAHGEQAHHSGIARMLKRFSFTHRKVVGCHRTQAGTRKAQAQ